MNDSLTITNFKILTNNHILNYKILDNTNTFCMCDSFFVKNKKVTVVDKKSSYSDEQTTDLIEIISITKDEDIFINLIRKAGGDLVRIRVIDKKVGYEIANIGFGNF